MSDLPPAVRAEIALAGTAGSPSNRVVDPTVDPFAPVDFNSMSVPELLEYVTGTAAGQLAAANNQLQLDQTLGAAGTQRGFAQDAFDLGGQVAEAQNFRNIRALANNFAARGLGNSGFRRRGLGELALDQAFSERGRQLGFDQQINQLDQQVVNAQADFYLQQALGGLL